MALDQLLPPPGASHREVLFRRLLLQCSKHISAQQNQQQHVEGVQDEWRKDPKLHSTVELLKERLFDLEKSKDSPSPDVLASYWAQVSAAAAELRPADVPPYCRQLAVPDPFTKQAAGGGQPQPAGPPAAGAPSGQRLAQPPAEAGAAAAQATAGGLAAGSTGASMLRRPRPPHSGSPSSQLQQPGPGGPPGRASAGAASSAAVHWSDEAKRRLATQAALQAELGEELLGMTAELKAGALAMHSAIRHRGKLLDQTETALVNSTANAQAVAAGASRQYRASRVSFCTTCLVLLGVGLVTAGMLVVIRLTAMVGLGKR